MILPNLAARSCRPWRLILPIGEDIGVARLGREYFLTLHWRWIALDSVAKPSSGYPARFSRIWGRCFLKTWTRRHIHPESTRMAPFESWAMTRWIAWFFQTLLACTPGPAKI